jgi:hypothetical protein
VNTITWFNYDDTDADVVFNVYRSIPGIEFAFASLSANPKFRFAATSPDIQEITIDTSNIDAAVASLNSGKGISAKKTSDNLKIQIRLTAQSNARLKLYSCVFLEDLNIQPNTIIVPGLNFTLVATQVYIETVEPYEVEDQDGEYQDLYYITSTLDGEESLPSIEITTLLPGVNYCITEARFIDVQGRPVHGVEVIAEPAYLDTQNMSTNKVKVISDAYGRVSLPLVQCQYYVLHIPAIGYNQFIKVPQVDFLDITKWPASMDPEYTP